MRPLLRIAIVVAAMITGGYFAAVLADDFYLPSAGPGEGGIGAAQTTIVFLIPAAAIVCGIVAAILTRQRRMGIVVLAVICSVVAGHWATEELWVHAIGPLNGTEAEKTRREFVTILFITPACAIAGGLAAGCLTKRKK
jgi:hypothetical protein